LEHFAPDQSAICAIGQILQGGSRQDQVVGDQLDIDEGMPIDQHAGGCGQDRQRLADDTAPAPASTKRNKVTIALGKERGTLPAS
jgi:hypothetical protein